MITSAQNMLPHRLRLKTWDRTHNYELDIKQTKIINQQERSTHCRIPITIAMVHRHEKATVFRLEMDKPAFNGSRDYDKLQWVFAKLMSLSREVHIHTRRSGAVSEILNEQQIQKHWTGVKQQIIEIYEDPLVDDLLKRYEQNLTHRFQSLYRRELMLHFLFNDLFRHYSEEEPSETNKVLPRHLGDIPFPIREYKQLTQLESLRHRAIITVEGSPDTGRIDTEAVNRYLGKITGSIPKRPYRFTYRGQYQIDTRLGCIKEAFLRVEGRLGEVYQKRTIYNLTTINHE